MKKFIFFMLAFVLFVTGCANRNFHPRVEFFGAYEDTSEINKTADEMTWAEASDIEVFVGTFPEGVDYQNGKITVDQNASYKVLGKVYTNLSHQGYFKEMYWFGDYPEDQSWRDGYCHWQVPMKWITLGLWHYLPGFYYPCIFYSTNSSDAIEERKSRIVKTLRKAAKAAGGDIVIITTLGQIETIDANSGQRLNLLDMTGASGFILKRTDEADIQSNIENTKTMGEENQAKTENTQTISEDNQAKTEDTKTMAE